ncbi:MAG: hypothetical protein U5L95_04700 [Candidatus Saccharibacteria bacterium]|nr:hypothetical protein [Candidatus Saccharibacteria bacterium]
MKEKFRSALDGALKHLKQLRDVRVLGLYVFIAIALLVTINSVSVIQSNYELQQRVSRIQQENDVQRLENETLRLKNQYYETDQYLELAARQQFNKGEPGETLLLVPSDVAMSHAAEELPLESPQESAPQKPGYQQNFEAWMEFIFRRGAEI